MMDVQNKFLPLRSPRDKPQICKHDDGCSKQVPSASFATGQATDVWEGDRLTLLKPFRPGQSSMRCTWPGTCQSRRAHRRRRLHGDVGSSTLHQGHETLILHDLDEAVHGALVLDTTAGGHHHPPPHRVNGVGHESSSDGDSPPKEEG